MHFIGGKLWRRVINVCNIVYLPAVNKRVNIEGQTFCHNISDNISFSITTALKIFFHYDHKDIFII